MALIKIALFICGVAGVGTLFCFILMVILRAAGEEIDDQEEKEKILNKVKGNDEELI